MLTLYWEILPAGPLRRGFGPPEPKPAHHGAKPDGSQGAFAAGARGRTSARPAASGTKASQTQAE